jgi:uncharacterized OB-fold protein
MALAAELAAEGEVPIGPCLDPVNAAMIRNWTQALGDRNPLWAEFAPPAMIQVWSMPGLGERRPAVSDRALSMLHEAGYTGVVATDCEQTYDRYLRLGEELRIALRLGDVIGPKQTALGEGYFVTWYQTWYAGDERVAEMLFRVLKFKPRDSGDAAPSPDGRYPLRPATSVDTRFFWEGVEAGELRIQKCNGCGHIAHPPQPLCASCGSGDQGFVVASGRGVIYSHVTHHYPPLPGVERPHTVLLVELEEGVRIVSEWASGVTAEPVIGTPVQVAFTKVPGGALRPTFRPA